MTLEVSVNGEPRELPAGATVLDLVASLGLDPRLVAVEHNGTIVRRGDQGAAVLAAGDRLEVVRFVQGG